ncbi:DMT family transporter [Flavobacterium silvaticum]|uniref:DMT family transporter n=1 Tax=Flavobacterium silvaticum TaxID=1852020 RepID=A0A972FJQ1_9FLAO|nr:DMT family transporter [Flavobacterium silvaticum]NMH27033.1 DMT family transporter [Flavobacterium silvaticum]
MPSNLTKWFLLIPLALIWGSSFILIKRGLLGLSPFELGALRLTCASTFLIVIGWRSLLTIPTQKWKYLALTAACGSFFPAFLFALGQTHISSTVSAIMNSLTPLNVLIIGIWAYKIDFKRIQVFGVLIGMIGSCVLILCGSKAVTVEDFSYVLLVYVACICYAANINFIKTYLSDLKPLAISAGNATLMLLPALAILFTCGFFHKLDNDTVLTSAGYIIILGIVGTGVANILFFRLIQISTPVFASAVTYLIPIVAFGWGVLDGEALNVVQCLGALIVLCGVYLSSKK